MKIDVSLLDKNQEIVTRLKKLIEKNIDKDCGCEYGGCRHSFADELQKIIGEKK